ncbi:hypothetical protein CP532_0306 [Ophiocordyceps camponoti-leonardi (nom. inval.)]|nr:hypothetical protein CP532_0306 [Ophiocordyceps camponoti-leonardi (nom. inval.)]
MKTLLALGLLPLLATAATGEAKTDLLPWLPPSSVAERCGGPIGFWEIICGTKKYCEAYDTHLRWIHFPSYDNKSHCLEAHEQPSTSSSAAVKPPETKALLPWYERTAECRCGLICRDEEQCGSAEYCSLFDSKFFYLTSGEHASTAECFAAREPRPETKAPAAKKKLPYTLEPSERIRKTCGLQIYEEDRCGTKRYCLAFDLDRAYVLGTYLDAKECFAAHEPAPEDGDDAVPLLKWSNGLTQSRAHDDCKHVVPHDDPQRSPQQRGLIVCGTKFFCEQYDTPWAPDRRWRRASDCYAAFEKDPADSGQMRPFTLPFLLLPFLAAAHSHHRGQTNLPWVKPSRVADRCGGPLGFREIICGTERYCDSYDTHRKWTELSYRSKEACLAAHQPPPSNLTLLPPGEPAVKAPPPLLPWREADKIKRGYCLKEEDCGTALYCASFDTKWIYFTQQEYPSSVECLAAREPRPAPAVEEKRPYLLESEHPYWSKLRCGMTDYTPFFCGTRRYCLSFDLDRAYAIGPYSNAEECFAAFDPPPEQGDDAVPLRGWVEPQAEPCSVRNETRPAAYLHCGTKWLCERYDTSLKEDLRYRDSTECFAAFEPRPLNGGYRL